MQKQGTRAKRIAKGKVLVCQGILPKTSRVLLRQVMVDAGAVGVNVLWSMGVWGGYKAPYLWSVLSCVVDLKPPEQQTD